MTITELAHRIGEMLTEEELLNVQEELDGGGLHEFLGELTRICAKKRPDLFSVFGDDDWDSDETLAGKDL